MKHRDTERAAEMELAIALWQESGLTKYSFCKQEALCRSTFDYWLVKYGKMPKKDKSSPVKKQDINAYVAAATNQAAQQLLSHNINDPEIIAQFAEQIEQFIQSEAKRIYYNYDNRDLFALKIDYTEEDPQLNNKAQFNGNISATKWVSAYDRQIRAYGYQYDEADRLTNAQFAEHENLINGYNQNIGRFSVKNLSYDAAGNILSLKRYGKENHNSYGNIDDLQYSYIGNQLQGVDELSSLTGINDFQEPLASQMPGIPDYLYDANGNMTQDDNKGSIIHYNLLNLPKSVQIDGNEIEFTYTAGGQKLRQTIKQTGQPENQYLFH